MVGKHAKQILKILAGLLGAILLLFLLGMICLVLYYNTVVSAIPGALEVSLSPGTLGAEVNLFSGTGGIPYICAYNSPAACHPLGMVRLAPDTASILVNALGLNASGYYYGDNKIIGFSHTRLVGADAMEGGHFRVFPTTRNLPTFRMRQACFARFSHKEEVAFPGYYAVRLPTEDILVELTASPRAGVHRYTFPPSQDPRILLDVTSVIGKRTGHQGHVRVLLDRSEIEGSVHSFGTFSGRYGGIDVHFVARFSEPFLGHVLWNEGQDPLEGIEGQGSELGVDLLFPRNTAPIEVRLALSYVSVENARANLEAEVAGKDFEVLFHSARDAWEDRFRRIQIQGGTATQRRIFYTALYRSFQMPTLFQDVHGHYRGIDKGFYQAQDFHYYTDFSLWDTFRTVHPLYNLIARQDQRDMMVSLVEMAKAGGCLPRWPAGCGYTNCMMGTPADIAVTEAYLKGIRDIDIETAYMAMRQTALEGKPEGTRFAGRSALDDYLSLGYVPSDKASKSVSLTLEFGWADYAISLLAEALELHDDASLFGQHARFYKNLWNPETLYFHPRDSQGRFQEDFRPLLLSYVDWKGEITRAFCEGSALQWRYAVPYDPEGLISLFPSREVFVRELNEFFEKSTPGRAHWNPGPYYWHGNEPDIHSAYLFNAAGRPDLTQKWVRWILDNKYTDDYVGLDGNDDAGTLSAWYVLSSLGFYPIAGTTRYEIGAPLFPEAHLHMNGFTLSVFADNFSPKHLYVQEVLLHGVPLERTWFTHEEIARGGELRFLMSASPALDPAIPLDPAKHPGRPLPGPQ